MNGMTHKMHTLHCRAEIHSSASRHRVARHGGGSSHLNDPRVSFKDGHPQGVHILYEILISIFDVNFACEEVKGSEDVRRNDKSG
jgi:hypothetical protein